VFIYQYPEGSKSGEERKQIGFVARHASPRIATQNSIESLSDLKYVSGLDDNARAAAASTGSEFRALARVRLTQS
jgi:hypothetical protein